MNELIEMGCTTKVSWTEQSTKLNEDRQNDMGIEGETNIERNKTKLINEEEINTQIKRIGKFRSS